MMPETLVGIASNSKGFTCTSLAILADEGKLNWDDKVTKFLPDFKMYDDYVTQELTIKDLVTHRAGLGLGQGDLMFFPEGGTMTTGKNHFLCSLFFAHYSVLVKFQNRN